MKYTKTKLRSFQQKVWSYYDRNHREMPWRETDDPYRIFVSEIMLQQTQVKRVIPKYQLFITRFPTVHSLAEASLSDVLMLWSGLGYNRRAKYLHESAKKVAGEWGGRFPASQEKLSELKGVGVNTAGAIVVYSFNKPAIFIETNIRAALIHTFFPQKENVDDSELLDLINVLLPEKNPREWYWALMDYGSHIKKVHKNPTRKSKTYIKQRKFEGSFRQIRGKIIKTLTKNKEFSTAELRSKINDPRIDEALRALKEDGLITQKGRMISLKD